MPAWLAPAAIGLGTTIGSWFGESLAEKNRDKDLARIMALFNPESITDDTSAMFDAFRGSPMYSLLRNRAAAGAAGLGNQLQTSFARAGLGRSGIAAAAMPIARSSFSNKFQEIDAEMWAQALKTILGNRPYQMQALQGRNTGSPFSMGLGKGLEIMGPYFRSLMTRGGAGLPTDALRGAANYDWNLEQPLLRRG